MLNPAKLIPKCLSAILLSGLINITNADVLVLIHGYMGSPSSWEDSRVNELLERNGWRRGGLIIPDTREYFPDPIHRLSSDRAENITYVVDMPWMRPLDEQAEFLNVRYATRA